MLRVFPTNDVFFIIMIISIILIASTKILFEQRFILFSSIIINSKYLRIFSKDLKFFDYFNALLFLNFILNISVFTILFLYESEISLINTIIFIGLSLCVFTLLRHCIELLVSYIFNLKKIIHLYIFYRTSFLNYVGLVFIPLNGLIVFSAIPNNYLGVFGCIILIFTYLRAIISFLKLKQETLKKHHLYFILYLCALEISPYLFFWAYISKNL